MLRINTSYKLVIKIFFFVNLIFFCINNHNISFAQIKAFPGAEGFGTDTVHGRGGKVIHVTNLNASGTGSLKAACEEQGARIVVFDVSGIIDLGNSAIFVQNPYLYIAGQTAPGDGICLKNGPLIIHTHDVVVRFIRSRPGDEAGGYEKNNRDGITIDGDYGGQGDNFYNIVVDHCSVSWAVDENIGTWFPLHDVTFSWNIISEALEQAGHPKDQHHSMGLLVGDNTTNVSIHHNYLASNDARNPLVIFSSLVDVVNNVVYNFGQFALQDENNYSINYVKNYVKRGPNSTGDTPTGWSSPTEVYGTSSRTADSVYLEGNLGWNRTNDTQDETLATNISSNFITDNRFPTSIISENSSVDVVAIVLSGAGATAPKRDSVDARIVSDFENVTGMIIDSQNEVGGWPAYNSSTPPTDTDRDGMPDIWETSRGLKPLDSSDGSQDRDNDGYTNIEEYINSLTINSFTILSPQEFKRI